MADGCTCTPPDNPSVVGASACPFHGLKATARDRDSWQALAHSSRERAERAEAERDRYRKALRFYADEHNWGDIHYGTNAESVPGAGPGHLSFSYSKPMARDLGKRAKDALDALEEYSNRP